MFLLFLLFLQFLTASYFMPKSRHELAALSPKPGPKDDRHASGVPTPRRSKFNVRSRGGRSASMFNVRLTPLALVCTGLQSFALVCTKK
jgi:hypothetical protein